MPIPIVGGFMDRLARSAAVLVVAGLIGGGWLLQSLRVPPSAVAGWLNGKLLYDLQVVVPLLPWLALLAFLAGIVFMVGHHRELALSSAGFCLAFIVIAIAWNFGLGDWVTAHLAA